MDQQQIGQFIRGRRQARSLTQQELADRLGVTNKAVSKWEKGRSMPDVGLFEPLCRELEISIPELLAGHTIETEARQQVTEELLLEYISNGKLLGLQAYLMINTVIGTMLATSPLLFRLEKPFSSLLFGFGLVECALVVVFDCVLPGKDIRRGSFLVRVIHAVALFFTLAVVSYPATVRAGESVTALALIYAGACLASILLSYCLDRARRKRQN